MPETAQRAPDLNARVSEALAQDGVTRPIFWDWFRTGFVKTGGSNW